MWLGPFKVCLGNRVGNVSSASTSHLLDRHDFSVCRWCAGAGRQYRALGLFIFVIHHLISQFGIANWSSLGVAALSLAILGGIWLIGNSLLDIIVASGSRRYATKRSRRTQITLPWLIVAAVTGALFYLFGE